MLNRTLSFVSSSSAKMKLHLARRLGDRPWGCAMKWFGKRHQQHAEKPHDIEKAIAVISARLIFLETLTSQLVLDLPPKKRDHLLEQVQQAISGRLVFPPPEWVPASGEQDFRDELRRSMRIIIEKTRGIAPL
jgi:hypothetical protein